MFHTTRLVLAALAIFNLPLLASAATPPPLSNPDVSPEPAEGVAYVGALNGNAAVSAAGNAAYSIPIDLPPGRRGLAPSLSINYNSNMQNGMLGLGWFLSGMSKINRCPRTISQEGVTRPVKYNSWDRYCMDGHKLFAVSGTYGVNGTLYRTEIDQFSSIRSEGTGSQGPLKFTVKTKSGLVMEYGHTADSRVEGQGTSVVRTWALNKVSDAMGNAYHLHYIENNGNGRHYIDRITYNADVDLSGGVTWLAPDTEVKFVYSSRPDNITQFEAGSKVQRAPVRLANIQTTVDDNLISDYRFSYQTVGADNRSRITQITRCDSVGSGGSCQDPINIEWWHDGSTSFTVSNMTVPHFGANGSTYNSDAARIGYDYNIPRWHDMNGDGKPDYVHPIPSGNGSYPASNLSFRIKLSTPTGYTTQTWSSHLGGHPKDFHWVDIDGNGTTDIVKLGLSPGTVDAALSTGSGFTSGSPYDTHSFTASSTDDAQLADVNGDGLIDLVEFTNTLTTENGCTFPCPLVLESTKVDVHLNKGAGNGFYSPVQWLAQTYTNAYKLVDLSGDGLVDLLLRTYNVFLNDGTKFGPSSINFGATSPAFPPVAYADIDGDGVLDRKTIDYNYECCDAERNTGREFIDWASSGIIPVTTIDDNRVWDGFVRSGPGGLVQLSDLSWPSPPDLTTTLDLYLAQNGDGASYTNQTHSYSGQHLGGFAQWTDLNGDGLKDLTMAKSSQCKQVNWAETGEWFTTYHSNFYYCENNSLKVLTQNGKPLSLVKTITQGQGVETHFTYKPLTDSSVYTKGTSATFPDYDIQDATHVVSSMTQSNGIGGVSTVDYTYEGLVRNVQGRGDKGFAKITASDQSSGTTTITEYAQEFPYTSQPTKVEQRRTSDSRLLSQSQIAYAVLNTASTDTKFPYVSNRVEKQYALSDGRLLSTKTTTNSQVDIYGNVGKVTSLLEDHETGHDFQSEEATLFTVDSSWANWRVGQVASVTQKAWLNDVNDPTKDRATSFTYDGATGLLLTETTEPGKGAGIESTRSLTYDALGNVISETISSPGVPSRVSTITYDDEHHFPETLTNPMGHVVTQTWDPAFGNKLTETDVNGLQSSWTYDSFGRLERVTNPGGTYTETELFTYDGVSIPHAVFYKETISSGKAPVRVYFDKLGRKLRTRSQAFDGRHVNVDINYDNQGRAYRTSEPYFDGDSLAWNTNSYDFLSRVTSLAAADSTQNTSVSYDGFSVTTTDVMSRSEVRKTDAKGQIIEVIDKDQTVMQFDYDAVGNRTAVHNAVGLAAASSVTYSYDRLGRQLSQDDPDHGLYTYTYDAFGNKLTEVSPKMAAAGQSVSYGYDKLDRMVSRSEPEGTTTWTYDETANGNLGVGQLHSESQGGFTKIHRYAAGNYGRLTSVETTIDGNAYETRYEYDANGRVWREYYPASNVNPAGFRVEYLYSPVGPLEAVQSPGGGTVYYQLIATDAAGRITEEWKGDGSTLTQGYAGHSSRITSQQSVNVSGSTFQHFAYDYDNAGNMTDRSDLVHSLDETFTYDDLDRLTSSQVGAGTVQNYGFDVTGNLTQKTSDYTYGYNLSQLHAVSDITGAGSLPDHSYGYDANGNLETIDSTPTITWSSYNKPVQISSGGVSYQFSYGPDRKRYRKIHNGETTHYIGANFEAIGNPATGMDVFRHYIRANGKVVMIREDDQGTVTHKYVHRDHLGSLTALTIQSSGAVLERFSYDAWGKRREATDWVSNAPVTDEIRGYTGHEHLDDVDIIHMNGRVYAPQIGRMLSPDPVTQAPENGQNYNRYAYGFDNPLRYTDPSGFTAQRYKRVVPAKTSSESSGIEGDVSTSRESADDLVGLPYSSSLTRKQGDRISYGGEAVLILIPDLMISPHYKGQGGKNRDRQFKEGDGPYKFTKGEKTAVALLLFATRYPPLMIAGMDLYYSEQISPNGGSMPYDFAYIGASGFGASDSAAHSFGTAADVATVAHSGGALYTAGELGYASPTGIGKAISFFLALFGFDESRIDKNNPQ